MTEQNTKLGIWLMILTTFIFALQDGLSRHLAGEYNVMMVVMIRYWFFAAFVIAVATRKAGGIRAAAKTSQPILQTTRGVLLALEICVMVLGFTYLGLIESQAVFIAYPLIIAALSGPILGESVGWRRWSAIGVGFVGVMIILEPGFGVFAPAAILPLLSAFMFAIYGLLNRYVARRDTSATSFFWTGWTGAVVMTATGIWFWEPMSGPDWALMTVLCITGALGHYTLIRVYELAEASAVQPFAYFQLGFGSLVGIFVFGESIRTNVAIGAALIIAAGLFTLWRERQQR
ncbi:DMT family transporter [Pseudooceanicola sediminis]|uniref:DMT family transporter n=1 Tax=Pseudooceanicola sediminis TaxID=2211117 RepID=A0A399IWF9_9RHOB|nr:DMT family transporter [Pseudooceanicola sediminis]KAA2312476.1 DMT family transporter [Puniceibacterium sp. HSS470]RII37485.1 DMT family transporter [Pseudooceanicola sediminis]|tara:strand:+ start:33842 stop:34708 length:867 start_codon:yes stop_codon:yes gene_type:complete